MIPRAAALLCAVLLLGGCAAAPQRNPWGSTATLSPGWNRIAAAARDAALDPMTWVPVAGAVVFSIGDLDDQTSEWAIEHQPVFGDNAEQISDDLRYVSTLAYVGTALLAPDDSEDWLVNKGKGMLVGLVADGATQAVTEGVKEATDRERPNGHDDKSFPSGHTSHAATMSGLAVRNLDSMNLGPVERPLYTTGLYGIAVATGWARVEAGWHYPSDVLAGMALGNFSAQFFHRAFLDDGKESNVQAALLPLRDGYQLQIGAQFH